MSFNPQQLEEINNYYKLKGDAKSRVKCINCNRKGGMLFEETNTYLKATCNAEPKCDFSLYINKGDPVILLPELLDKLRSALENEKAKMIQLKIEHAIGLIGDDDAIQRFENHQTKLKSLTTAYSSIDEKIIFITNNIPKLNEITQSKIKINAMIEEFKDMMTSFKNTSNQGFLEDAIQKYQNEMIPELDELRNLLYKEIRIENEKNEKNEKILIQKEYTVQDLEIPYTSELKKLLE